MFNIKISGGTDWEKMQRKIEDTLFESTEEAGINMHDEIEASIDRQGGPGNHSAPGEPPRKITGNLQGSLETAVYREELGINIKTSAGAEYAKALEYGTGKIKPRPFMLPALFRNYYALKEKLKKYFKEG